MRHKPSLAHSKLGCDKFLILLLSKENGKWHIGKIFIEIGKHRSTIYREINRNRFEDSALLHLSGYYNVTAQRTAQSRRARRSKLIWLESLRAHVVDRLLAVWTPEQIAGRLGYDDQPVRVSHETIYAYIKSSEGQSEQLARHLPSRCKKRHPRYARRPRG